MVDLSRGTVFLRGLVRASAVLLGLAVLASAGPVSAGEAPRDTALTGGAGQNERAAARGDAGARDRPRSFSSAPQPAAPDKVTGLSLSVQGRYITATWDAPSGAVTGYDVEWKYHSGTQWYDAGHSGTTASHVLNRYLVAKYDVRIRAKDGSGHGQWSDIATASRLGTVKNVALTAGDEQIDAAWDVPTEDTSNTITGYDVQYRAKGADNWVDAEHSGTTTEHAITGLTDGTAYQVRVRATNDDGSGNWSNTQVSTPGSAPAKVTNLSLAAGDGRIDVDWDAPTGTAITGYDVEYSIRHAASWTDAGHTGTGTEHPITSLTNGTAYDVRVRAKNSAGSGDWAGPIHATPSLPPDKVTGLQLTREDRGFSAAWDEPNDHGAGITGYHVAHRQSGTTDWKQSTTPQSTRSKNFTNLINGTTYEVRVRAVASATLHGAWSDIGSVTPASRPGSVRPWPKLAAGDKQIAVTWTAPSSALPIAGYDVEYKLFSAPDSSYADSNHTGTETSHTISGLTNGNTYNVRVRAENNAGMKSVHWSGAPWAVAGNNPPEFSGPDTANFAENGAGTVLTVTANDPDSEDEITWIGFQIPSSNYPDNSLFDINNDTGVLTFKTAPNFEDAQDADGDNIYEVTVGAKGGAFPRDLQTIRTYKVTVTDVVEVPGKPAAPTVATAGSGKLTISWTEPANTGPAITGYTLQHSTDGSSWTEVTPSSAVSTSYTLTNLTHGVTYQVQVRATNAEGDGAWSDSGDGRPITPGTAAILLNPVAATVNENGDTDTYKVKLETAPTANVTVTVSSNNTAAATISPASLTFDSSNWGTEQAVTVTGVADMANHPSGKRETTVGHTASSDDSNYGSISATLNVDVLDANSAPTFSGATTANFAENGTDAALTVTANDPDSQDTVSYAIKSGKDGSRFNIGASSGELSFKRPPNYENPQDRGDAPNDNTYAIDVLATGGSGSRAMTVDQEVLITVTDVNEPPDNDKPPLVYSTDNSGELRVTWIVSTSGPNITGYKLRYGTDGSNWTEATPDWSGPGDRREHLFDTLTDGTEYQVQVQATNDEGTGGWSASGRGTPGPPNATPGIRLTPEAVEVNENGGTATYAVKLATAPTANVTVAVSSSDATAATVSPASLTFTSTDWGTGQQVTVTGVDDDVVNTGGKRETTVTHTATSTDTSYSGLSASLDVDILEVNGAPAFSGATTVEFAENGTGTALTVSASDPDGEDGTASIDMKAGKDSEWFDFDTSTGALTFKTPPNHEDPKDGDTNNSYVVDITATAGSSTRERTTEQEFTITVTNAQEPPGKPAAPTVETASGGELSVSWAAPTNTGPAISGYKLRYGTDGSSWTEVTPDPATSTTHKLTELTDGTEYQVQVHASNAEGDGAWSDSGKGTPVTPVVPGILLDPTAVTVNEDGDGNTATYKVKLATAPTADVTVALTVPKDDPNDPDLATVNPTSLTFTASNWNTEQEVTVTGVDDDIWSLLGSLQTTVAHTASSTDTGYDGLSMSLTVTVAEVNGPPAFTGDMEADFAENGTGAALTAAAEDPDGEDTVSHSIKGGKDGNFFNINADTGALTFKSVPDFETPRDSDGDNTYVIDVEAKSGDTIGPFSRELAVTGEFTITVTDVTPPDKPDAPTVATAGDGELAVSWTAPTGSPINSYKLRHSTDGSTWTEVAPDPVTSTSHTLANLVNDTEHQVQVRASNVEGDGGWSDSGTGTPVAPVGPGILLNPDSVEVDENGGTATYTVKLATAPTADVTVAVDSGDTAAATVSTASLTFTSTDWATAQEVTVTGVDDDVANAGGKRETTVSHSASSDDSNYNSVTASLDVDILEVNGAPTFSGETTADFDENGTGTALTVSASDPDGEDTVAYAIKSGKDGDKFTINTSTGALTFKVAPNYEDPQDSDTNNSYVVDVQATAGAGARALTAEQEFTITVKDVDESPAKPDAPTVAAAGSGELSVSWSAPGNTGPAISGYKLRHSTDGSTWTEVDPDPVPSTSHTLTSLVNDTEYQVQVRASNDEGEGDWSDSATGTPQPDKPGQVANLVMTAGDEQASAAWDAPSGTVAGYDVQTAVRGEGWESCPSTIAPLCPGTLAVTNTSTDVTGLSNGTEYAFRVRAKNSGGAGDWSDTAYATPQPGVPGQVTNLSLTAGDGEIDATWDVPSGTVTGYDVEYKESSASSWTDASHTGTNASHTINSLTNGTGYDVRVRAKNGSGNGVWSATASATPQPDAPGQVINLALTAGNEQLSATWDVPSGTISGYDVEYKESSASSWTDAGHSGTTASHTIGSLTNGTGYDVRVRATNSGGNGAWSATASATPQPDAPGQVTNLALTAGDTQLSATWEVPSGTITGYDVEYKESSASSWTDASHTGTSASHNIDSLTNGTEYDVRVRATNSGGNGDWSDTASATPQPGVPGQVTNLALTAGDEQLSATWDVPSGTITGYDVEYKESSASSWTDAGHTGTNASHTIGSLTNGTEYDVRVRAKNSGGNGDWSDTASATPQPGAPGQVTNLALTAGDEQLSATWDVPSGTITGYDVEYKESSASSWTDTGHTGTNASHTISSLTNGTGYDVRVRATNAGSNGAWSVTASATPGTVPDEVTGLTLTAGNVEITASWTAPGNGGAAITTYTVDYTERGTGWDEKETVTVTAPATSTTLTDLTNGTEYAVRVSAANTHGNGDWSDTAYATPQPGVPGQVTNLDLTAGDGEIDATWDVPSGTVTGYDVEYKETSASSWTNANHTGTTASHNIDSLTNGTAYDVRVRAKNGSGNGVWSATASATPQPEAPGQVTNLALTTGNEQLSATWEVPSGTITGYDVEYKESSASSWTDAGHTGTNASHTIGSLTNDTGYDVRVRATNSGGNGVWSATASATPQPGTPPPGQVNTLSLTAGIEQISATWAAPTGAVTGYDVEYKESSASSWTDAGHTGTDASHIINSLTNGTEYNVRVRAKNGGGNGAWSATASATPLARPARPTNFVLTPDVNALDFTFQQAGSAASYAYIQKHRKFGDSFPSSWTLLPASASGNTVSTSISGLDAETAYNVRVRACVNFENGSRSTCGPAAGFDGTTVAPQPGVPGQVTNLALTAGDEQLSATWDAPSGTITGYDVEYRESSASSWTDAGHTGTNASHTIDSLTNGTAYDVRVRAKNDSGNGAWSDTASATPQPDAPGQVTNLALTAGDGEINATWDVPSGTVTGYDVEYKESSASSWTDASHTGTNASHSIGSLTNGTGYDVRVRAKNGGGNGDWSATASATPQPDAPGQVTNLALTAGDEQLSATWDVPSGAVTGYDVEYKESSASSWTDASHSGTDASHTISSLTNGTGYDVRVRAKNGGGNGTWSDTVSATPVAPQQPPAAPTNLAVTAGNAQVSATWDAPSGTVTGYDVQTAIRGQGWESCPSTTAPLCPDTLAVTNTSTDVTGLSNGTEYAFRVRAKNTAGESDWSDTAYATPQSGVPGQVTNLDLTAGDGEIDATWDVPSGTITGYDVEYKESSASSWTDANHTGTNASHTIDSLTNGTGYDVRVRAKNDGGNGAWSATASATPQPDAPGQVTNLALTAGDGEIDAIWDVPSGTVTGYDVEYKESSASSWTDASHSGTTASHSIGSLTNGTGYDVRVRATNSGGNGAWSATASATPQPEAPGQVTNLSLTAGDGEIDATWDVPSGTITGYDVEYKESSASSWTDAQHSGTDASHTINSLTNGTGYDVRVRAKNGGGNGDWSDTASATPVAPQQPPAAPTNLSMTAGNAQASATWTAPTGTVTGYDVQTAIRGQGWESCPSTSAPLCPDILTVTSTSADITGLSNATEYAFRVRAKNTAGESDWSDTAYATPQPGVPGQVTNLDLTAGDGEIDATWDVPSGTITGYDVEYKESSASSWTDASHTGMNASHTIGSLTNGTEYDVRVRAKNGGGNGAWSDTASATPQLDAPGQVTNLALTAGDGEIDASWDVPSGTITGYDVEYKESGVSSWTDAGHSGTTASHTIDSLTNGTAYDVRVRAKNGGGNGAWSATASATPQPGAPGQVTNLALTAGDGEIDATWDVPSGTVTGYDVEYKESSASSWTDAGHTGTNASHTIDSLTNGTEYDVRVRAKNGGGNGAWSDTASATPVAPQQPPAAPTNLSMTAGNAQASATWDAPSGTVTEYDVQTAIRGQGWESCPSTSAPLCPGTLTVTSTSADITGLSNGTEYAFRVRAKNSAGDGAWSESAYATPQPGVPGQVTNLSLTAGDGEIDATWDVPSGTITGYDVEYKESSAGSWTDANHSGTSASHTIDSLTNGTAYDVRVRAKNGGGNGAWSATASATPQPGAPGQVTNLALTAGDGEIDATWDVPSGTITGYDVEYKESSASSWTDAGHSGTDASHSIDSLTNGTGYDVRVRAKNSSGNGAWSGTASATPQPGAPGQVTNLSLTAGDEQLSATWDVPSGTITGYDVEYKESSTSSWTDAGHTGTSASHSIGSLTNGTGYDVRVRAKNSSGNGAWSDTASATPVAPQQPPAAPINLAMTAGNAQASATWTAPTGTVTGYDVQTAIRGQGWESCPSTSAPLCPGTLTVTSTSADITGLSNGTEYAFRVRAKNSAGDGAWSESAYATPTPAPGVPGQVTNLALTAGHRRITATWSVPSGTVTGYDVEYKRSSDSYWTDAGHTGTNARLTITGLTNGTTYEVRVRAANGSIKGAWSDIASATPRSGPGVSQLQSQMTATATAQDGGVRVSWSAPVEGGPPVAGYAVQTAVKGRGWSSCPSTAAPTCPDVMAVTAASTEVAGLSNGMAYAFRVRATDAQGAGPWSPTAYATPQAGPDMAGKTPQAKPEGQAEALQPTPEPQVQALQANASPVAATAPVTPPDTEAPTVALALAEGGETPALAPFSIVVTFSEKVTGFALDDLSVAHGRASALSGSGASYTATITPEEGYAGDLTIDIAAGAARDPAGNASRAAGTLAVAVAPPVTRPTGLAARTTAGTAWRTLDLSFDAPPAYMRWVAANSQVRVLAMTEGAQRTAWTPLEGVSVRDGMVHGSTPAGLAAGQVFEVEVRYCGETVSNAGCGEASDRVYGATPASAPTDAQAVATASGTALQLTWRIEPVGDGNRHAAWEIGWSADPGATAPETLLSSVPAFGETAAEIEGLAADARYRLFVRSVIDWRGERLFASSWAAAAGATSVPAAGLAGAALKTALTGQARRLLEDASDVIGRRLFSTGSANAPLTAFAGLFGAPGPGDCPMEDSLGACAAQAVGEQQDRLSLADRRLGIGQDDAGSLDWSGSFGDLRERMRSQGFAVSLNGSAADGPASDGDIALTLWGGGGPAADGGSGSVFWGMDAGMGERWTAGLAFSGSDASSSRALPRSGAHASGLVESEVTAVYPYARGLFAGGLELWSVGGWGAGRFASQWSDALAPDASARLEGDLGFSMGLVGAERPLYEADGLSLTALGDAGWSRLAASGDEEMDVLVHRTRMGLEGRYASGDGSVTSSFRASARMDGGEESAQGVELAGALGHVRGRWETGLEGRWYEADAALTGLREQGVRAVLALRPQGDGTGLGLTLSPGWGTAAIGGDGLLAAFTDAGETAAAPALRLDGRVSWGARIGGWHVLRPYAEFSLDAASSRHLRGGVALEGPMRTGLTVERRENAAGPAEHGIMLRLDMSF